MKNVKDDLIFNAIDIINRIHNKIHLGTGSPPVSVIFRKIQTLVSNRVDGSNVRRIYSLLEFQPKE